VQSLHGGNDGVATLAVTRIDPALPVPCSAAERIDGMTILDGEIFVIAGLYGSLRVTPTGEWTYVPDPEDKAIQPAAPAYTAYPVRLD
jgi:hypothetical protein